MDDALVSPADQLIVDAKRQLALTSLQDFGVLLQNGHFDFGNGFHGTSYINPHALFDRPYVILRLAQDLLDVLDLVPGSVKRKTQIVAGPVTGGAQLAFVMAAFMDGGTKKKELVLYAPIHQVEGTLVLRKHYANLVRDKHVLLADDIRHTGSTFKQSFDLITKYGGNVIATTQLYDRMTAVSDLPVPNVPLAEYRLEQDLVPADQCPQCRQGIEITKF